MPDQLERILRVLRLGPTSARDVCQRLGISQPVFSRAVQRAPEVLVVGRARATRYAARRSVVGVSQPIPVYSVRPAGQAPRHLVDLHPVAPDGFYVEEMGAAGASGFVDDLPWFLANLRPDGYLGRLTARAHRDLGLPTDILRWSADHVLQYATRHGWNLPGALIAGEEAFRRFVELAGAPPDRVEASVRPEVYPVWAADVLAVGPAGSSAAGEQPKLLATVDHGSRLTPVLVKFSPPLDDAKAVRTADLLVAEHVAHEVLAQRGHPAARSTVLHAGRRVFLEVERFDRDGPEHRRGVVPLGPVDGALVGSDLGRWSTTTAALLARGLLTEADHREVRWREVFGDLIANSDMHPNNLSLWLDDLTIAGVAPSYDMLPMRYSVRNQEIVPVDFAPRVPDPSDADVARSAWSGAVAFWEAVADHEDVSPAFRAIARQNAGKVAALEPGIGRLPVR
jgi:hypothetical protein